MTKTKNESSTALRKHSVPAAPKHDYVRFIPLGGLDEVGMNCALLECNGSMVMIDCGLTFPEDDFGIDVVLPDWTYVMDNLDRLDAVLIIYGHEDHIGALDRKSTRLNSSHVRISYAVFCLKKKTLCSAHPSP